MQIYGQINLGKPIPSFPTIIKFMVASDGVTSLYKGINAAIWNSQNWSVHKNFEHARQKEQRVTHQLCAKSVFGIAEWCHHSVD